MPSTRQFLEQLLERRDLPEAAAHELLGLLTDPRLEPAVAGALLAALRAKGVTAAEVRGFAGAMGALSRKPALASPLDAIDIVGTGGDASGSLNLSTGAALLTAACGTPVVKHGNRSISSRSGSADMIEQLGLKLPLDETRAANCFEATGFTFLFAPLLSSGDAQPRADSHRARRANDLQSAGTTDQSGRAALPAHRRLRRRDRKLAGRHLGRHGRGARVGRAWRRGLG